MESESNVNLEVSEESSHFFLESTHLLLRFIQILLRLIQGHSESTKTNTDVIETWLTLSKLI